jgi:hypothetical protein
MDDPGKESIESPVSINVTKRSDRVIVEKGTAKRSDDNDKEGNIN